MSQPEPTADLPPAVPKADPKTCLHPQLQNKVTFERIADSPDARPRAFLLGVEVRCAECQVPFRFKGVEARSGKAALPQRPLTIAGRTVLLPVEPES